MNGMNEKNKKSTGNPVSNMDDCSNSYISSIVNSTDLKSTAKKQTSKSKKSSNDTTGTTNCK